MGTDIASVEPEWSLLRAACSPTSLTPSHPLLRSSVRWKVLFGLADHHGVQPLLCRALAKVEQLVPADDMRRLRRACEVNVHRAMFLSRELIRIIEAIRASGAEVLAHKGLALAELAYGDIALRQTGDIDLLIRPEDYRRVREAVRELGYRPHLDLTPRQERAYIKSGYECAFDGTAGPNLLEVQWAIQPRFYAVDIDMEDLFRRAVDIPVAGHNMKTLSLEDLLVVLSVHAAKHAWQKLIWICDIARIMSMSQVNWGWVIGESERLGVQRIVAVSMLLANRMVDAQIPAKAAEFVRSNTAAQSLAKSIENMTKPEESPDVESMAYFRLMLDLRERAADRVRFLSRLIFTPGPGEWAAVSLPSALFPLYRVVRLTRLAARIVRA